MENKGFTLIELLAVIAILGIVLTIAYPSIIGVLEKSEMEAYVTDYDNLVKAAKNYLSANIYEHPTELGETLEINFDQLKAGNFISDIKDPKSKSDYCNGYVLVTLIAEDWYDYSPFLNCGDATNAGNHTDDELLAYWKFDGNVYDYTPNDNHGEVHGNDSTNDYPEVVDAKLGKGYSLTSTAQYLSVPHNAELSSKVFGTSDNFTISAWIYPRTYKDYSAIISKATDGWWSNTTAGLWNVEDGITVAMGANVPNNPDGSALYFGNKPPLNEWHYIVMVADGDYLSMYTNGELINKEGIDTLTYQRSENTAIITFGRRIVSNGEYFDGIIDEIKVYGRPLSAFEVKLNYYIESQK